MVEIIIIVVCLFFQAFFAAFEMAFVALTRSRLKEMAKAGNATALRLSQLRQNPERTLSALQIGVTLVGALAAAVGGAQAYEKLSPQLIQSLNIQPVTANFLSVVLVVVPLTMVNVIFAELVPKTLALRSPLKIALFATKWLVLLDRLFLPFVDALEWLTKRILHLVFPRSQNETASLADTVELDQLSVQARQYVLNLVAIEKKRVKDVSLPWSQVDSVSSQDSIQQVEAVILRSGHTRLPVMQNGDIGGIINTKELLALVKAGSTSWTQIIRPISKVNSNDALLKALRQMQEKRSHLSAVFEGEVLTGIVTMEDILEEVIGEVYDEDDDGTLRRILTQRMRR
jgi:putative hemolysin